MLKAHASLERNLRGADSLPTHYCARAERVALADLYVRHPVQFTSDLSGPSVAWLPLCQSS